MCVIMVLFCSEANIPPTQQSKCSEIFDLPTYPPRRVDATTQTHHVDSTKNLHTVQEVMVNILYPIKKSFDLILADPSYFMADKAVDLFFQAWNRLGLNGEGTVNLTFYFG